MELKLIKRQLVDSVRENIENSNYVVIAGARQVGKSIALEHLHEDLEKKKKAVFRISFDDTAIVDSLVKDFENIFNHVPEPSDDRLHLLIDDIHFLPNADRFLSTIHESYAEDVKIVATCGTSFYYGENTDPKFFECTEIKHLYPLDFEEFLIFKGLSPLIKEWNEIRTNRLHRSYKRKKVEHYFNEYMTYGGYPEVVLAETEEEKIEILKRLSTTNVRQDIYEAHIQNSEKMYKMLSILAYKTGDLVNMSELSTTLSLSITAIENYLQILANNYHVDLVKPYYALIKKELKKMPKVYFNDIGIRNIFINQFLPVSERLDRQQLIENYVYVRLRMLYPQDMIKYWRTADGNEVDFVMLKDDYSGEAIEAKFSSKEFKESKYKKFSKSYDNVKISCRALQSEYNDQNILGL